MIDTVVIVVYNRFDNVEKWLRIWKKCDTGDTRLVVIRNSDAEHNTSYETDGVTHISRFNIGFDIGAFQDVCRNRLAGFPTDWKQLLWCTDDTFPMQKDFLKHFALGPGEGVRCMEISHYVRTHIRTTGFSVRREVAEKLQFPADPIVSKQHCYLFEHRWTGNLFIDQVKKMKYKVLQVADNNKSPMFDTGYHRRLPREAELNKQWGFDVPTEQTPRISGVTIICPIYKSFPAVISSLIMQTYKDWKLILIHDGPGEGEIVSYVQALNDDRITYEETPVHNGHWGHAIRSEYINKAQSDFIVITNPDNYYVPVFLEYMLKPFGNTNIVATYCSHMVHSYRDWVTQTCMLARGHVDCGGVMLRTKQAQEVGWKSLDHSADWIFFADIIKRFGQKSFQVVKGTLLVHN